MRKFRIVSSAHCGGFDKRQLRLASFDTLEQAEAWRPRASVIQRLMSLGYDRLEISLNGWADTAHGYAPLATLKLNTIKEA